MKKILFIALASCSSSFVCASPHCSPTEQSEKNTFFSDEYYQNALSEENLTMLKNLAEELSSGE